MEKSKFDLWVEKRGQAYYLSKVQQAFLLLGWAYFLGAPYFIYQCYAADQKFWGNCILAFWVATFIPVFRLLKRTGQFRADPSQARTAIIVILLFALVGLLSLLPNQ